MIKLNVNKKIGKEEIDILNEFLKKSNNDLERKLDIYWAEGYLCAIISSPNVIMPSEWQDDLIDPEYTFENETHYLCFSIIISIQIL